MKTDEIVENFIIGIFAIAIFPLTIIAVIGALLRRL
jgi:hypothetical protein